MQWPPQLSGRFGLKTMVTQIKARLFPPAPAQIVGEVFEATTILVAPYSKFRLCQFNKCTFVWEGEETGEPAKIFFSCNFDDCDFGLPMEEFIARTFGSTINQQYRPRLTPEQALEEAVRRVYQREPALTEQCLDPAAEVEREHLAQWVHAEYRKILMDA